MSGSRKFLEEIKKQFNIQFKIQIRETNNIIEGNRSIHGKGYYMCLGAEFFNEIMDNYDNSLQRKRKHFCTNEERIEKIKENYWNGKQGNKFFISKEELEKIVWEMPSERIAEKYGVSGRAITKRCRKLGIEKPPRGYWAKVKSHN